jgi:PAS domain S-box-containing protein
MDYLNRTKEELIEQLEDLSSRYDQLKSSYNRDISARDLAEKKLQKRSALLSALNQYAIELSEQDRDNILKYIVFKFKELFEVRGVWISRYDDKKSELIIETSTATDKENSRIIKYLGSALRKHKIVLDEENYSVMIHSGIKVFSSLYEMSYGQIPEVVSKLLQRVFNFGWFQGVALVDRGKLYGILIIAGCKGQEELDTDIIRIFAELTSNILTRKETETRLQMSEEKFRKVYMTSPDSININRFDNGIFVSVNRGFGKIMGYSEDEVLGKTSLDLLLWADPGIRDNLFKELREKGEVTNLEAKFRMKSGQIKDGIVSASLIDLDEVPHILSIVRDITDLKQNEEKYRLLAENISDVIWILDVDTMYFTYISPSVERLRGFTVEEIISKPVNYALTAEVAAAISKQTRQRAEDILAGREGTGEFFINEVEQPCKDGSMVWTEVVTCFRINKKGRVEVLGVTRNITERRKAEAEVTKLNAQLEERVRERTIQLEAANNELQAFAYSVSHDLRAPLRAIDGFSRFVLEDYSDKLDSEGQRLLGLIRSNTQKMDKLITDILFLSRVSRGENKKSIIDMTKMAVSMYNETTSSENRDKLSFIIENLPNVTADPTYIKQVWINLLSNAIKFSSQREKPEIKIGGYTKNSDNVYFVSDNGVGFNPEYSHKLFGVFQRLHKSDEFEGTGVGLAIVQRIIHRHGGKVWADGSEGKGATFYFSLPADS